MYALFRTDLPELMELMSAQWPNTEEGEGKEAQ